MKRFLAIGMVSILLVCSLAGCAGSGGKKDRLVIVTTIFPIYDWVQNIIGDNPADIEVKLLLENGVDLHNYQPTAADVMTIGESSLFLYVGGESDRWVEDALRSSGKKGIIAIALMDELGDARKREELVEGMQAEDEGEEEEEAYDEHIWLSVRNAALLSEAITGQICKLDEKNADYYRQQLQNYQKELAKLDAEYRETVEAATGKTLLFGDRFPFRYLTEDYGITYYAAFLGCAAEAEASFETVAFLADKLEELKLSNVIVLDGSNRKIAETIIRNSSVGNVQITEMNSMQSVRKADIEGGVTFLSVMRENLEALKKALQ